MDNEFMCITLTCEGDYVVPRNPPGSSKYPDVIGPNQACTLYGATPARIRSMEPLTLLPDTL